MKILIQRFLLGLLLLQGSSIYAQIDAAYFNKTVYGARLTNIASAYLLEPRIADKIILVWFGGSECQGLALAHPGATSII
jgi:hypothetical protein